MTFDDGPMGLPASPDRFEGKTLTDVLLDTLAQYGAKGSFDVTGDTSENYPDEAGKLARGVGRRQIRPLPRYPLRRQGRSRAQRPPDPPHAR